MYISRMHPFICFVEIVPSFGYFALICVSKMSMIINELQNCLDWYLCIYMSHIKRVQFEVKSPRING